MKTKKVRPVLVEIKDASNIFENNDKTLSFYEYKQHASSGGKKFELILISLEDEEIKVGEIGYITIGGGTIGTISYDKKYKTWDLTTKDNIHYPFTTSEYIKKVIARQSQISPEYISKFIEQYNKGCVEDLEIEMEKYWINSDNVKGNSFTEVAKFEPSTNDFDAVLIIQPKLTNGFVIIVEKEVISYTEEEVRKLISEALYHFCPMNNYREEDEIDWFENNKKNN